jgi:hypothetical protein
MEYLIGVTDRHATQLNRIFLTHRLLILHSMVATMIPIGAGIAELFFLDFSFANPLPTLDPTDKNFGGL